MIILDIMVKQKLVKLECSDGNYTIYESLLTYISTDIFLNGSLRGVQVAHNLGCHSLHQIRCPHFPVEQPLAIF